MAMTRRTLWVLCIFGLWSMVKAAAPVEQDLEIAGNVRRMGDSSSKSSSSSSSSKSSWWTTAKPTEWPTNKPTKWPTNKPTNKPTEWPTNKPTEWPTNKPTNKPTDKPTDKPTEWPTNKPTKWPTNKPTEWPTNKPTNKPTDKPTNKPTDKPTDKPTNKPTNKPTKWPTEWPTNKPTEWPTNKPTEWPTQKDSWSKDSSSKDSSSKDSSSKGGSWSSSSSSKCEGIGGGIHYGESCYDDYYGKTATWDVASYSSCEILYAKSGYYWYDAGKVCVSKVDKDTVEIKYSTDNGWYLNEVHAWLGCDKDDYPQYSGHYDNYPCLSDFPFKDESCSYYQTEASFTADISELDGCKDFSFCDYCDDDYNDALLYIIAQAKVKKYGSSKTWTKHAYRDGETVFDYGYYWALQGEISLETQCC